MDIMILFLNVCQALHNNCSSLVVDFCSEVVKQELDKLYEERKVKAVVTIQCWLRRWICRKRWPNLKRSLELQRKGRQASKTNHR